MLISKGPFPMCDYQSLLTNQSLQSVAVAGTTGLYANSSKMHMHFLVNNICKPDETTTMYVCTGLPWESARPKSHNKTCVNIHKPAKLLKTFLFFGCLNC